MQDKRDPNPNIVFPCRVMQVAYEEANQAYFVKASTDGAPGGQERATVHFYVPFDGEDGFAPPTVGSFLDVRVYLTLN